MEFQGRFPDEAACREYLFRSRWPDGFRCRRCASAAATALPRRLLWQCSACRYQVSVTAGSVLHRTRTSLHLWFWAAYLVTTGTPTRKRHKTRDGSLVNRPGSYSTS